jgi:hypothetical protein
LLFSFPSELGYKARLGDPGLAVDQNNLATARERFAERVAELGAFTMAANEGPTRGTRRVLG